MPEHERRGDVMQESEKRQRELLKDMTEEQVIQQAIRQAYQRDPYKAGDTAISGSILKHDNPHRQQD